MSDHHDAGQRPHDLHAVVLLLAGGGLLRIAATGAYASYVKASARPYLIAAGAAILALAVVSLWQAVTARRGDETASTAAEGHKRNDRSEHRHGRFDVAWLLVVPLAVLLVIAPKPAGAYEAGRAGAALPPVPSSPYGPLPSGDPATISVIDYVSRAVFDTGRTLVDRDVQLTGFLTAAPRGGWYLTRMLVTCCAADAQPIKVELAGSLPANAAADAWVTVIGRYNRQTAKDRVNGATIPFLSVSSVHPVAQPANPYES